MSAYGEMKTQKKEVPPYFPFALPFIEGKTAKKNKVFVLHEATTDSTTPEELAILQQALNHEIENGNTYPQEAVMTLEQFQNYFLSHNAFVARCPEENNVIAGMFYVKPNFPGRSSHICNGGFIVLPGHQGQGLGKRMGQAFLYIARDLGYSSSFFNLVFVNNLASVALWKSLGFEFVGRIPNAGRLKKQGSNEEEFVDANQVYYDFSKLETTPYTKFGG